MPERICGHEACTCTVPAGSTHCCDACARATDASSCPCTHPDCDA